MKIQEVTVKDANGDNITAGYFKSSYETHLQIKNNQLTIGKTHILHGFVKASAAATISCLTASAPVTTSWNEVSLLITPTSKMVDIVFSPGEYWIYNWKLEVGTIPSLWSPSSLDAKEDLKSVWSQYQQLSNKFDWIVKGDSESHMELTDKIYRLIAENINLSGKVTFSSFSTGLQEQITGINSNANQAVEDVNASITKVVVKYYLSSSSTQLTGGSWTTNQVTWKDGYYVWSKTVGITKAGDEVDVNPAVCITGNTGKQGTTGSNALQPTRNWKGTFSDNQSTTCSRSDFNRQPIVGDVFTNIDGSSNIGTWQVTAVNGSTITIKQLSHVNAKGGKGDKGTGATKITPQYYLSSSDTQCKGGSWQDAEVAWASKKYIWTRSKIEWDNGADPTYTTPVLAKALNNANVNANSALVKINGVTTIDKGKTVIDGGKIATGTILSDSIAANSIKADRLDVTDLSAFGATIGGWTISDTGISNDFWNEYDRISYTISLNTPDSADSKVIDLTKNNESQFYIMQSGKMYAKNADISGKITASSGKIGGYTISDYELVGKSVGISSLTGYGWAFWAGDDDSSKAPFRVGHDGHLYATNADISGTITSTDINNGNGTFKVDKDGKVTAKNLNMSGGSIALNGNLSNSTIDLSATDKSGNKYELWMNGAVLRIVKNDENLITLYGTTGSIGAQTMYAQEIQSDKFREPNRGYAMCGDATGHTYHCNWNGSALSFQVDTTWVWSSSDKRLKKNIEAINQDYIDAVGSVDLFQYNLNRQGYSDKPLYFGAMVQDIIESLKDKGHVDENLNMIFKNKATSDDDTLYYGMNYEQFLILRLAGDEQRIATLEQQISKLKEQI